MGQRLKAKHERERERGGKRSKRTKISNRPCHVSSRPIAAAMCYETAKKHGCRPRLMSGAARN
jgi:hypothetical protein